MTAATYVYPWDVVGDDAAAETIAGLGVDHAVVAAFYHATRALTPRHAWHRVVVAEHSASYLPVGDAWEQVLPGAQTWVDADDAFGQTAAALASAGVPTHAWVVVDHVDDFDAPHVVNAYGDVYTWALCPSHESNLEYAVGLAAVIAARPDVSGVEFEAAGWYGFDHLHEHDKVAGIPLSEDELYLMSLCFCDACREEYQASGIDVGRLRETVCSRLDARFAASAPLPDPALPDADLAAAVLGTRTRVANRLRGAMVREVRTQRDPDFPILFHANPDPRRSTAFTGLDVGTLPKDTGVVLNCWNGSTGTVTRALGHDAPVNAGLLGVRGMGSDSEGLAAQASAMREAGASGIRLYHAGIASNADLEAMRRAVEAFHGATH